MHHSPTGSEASPGGSLEQLLEAARAGSTEALGRVFEGCRHYLLLVANEGLESDLHAKAGASDLVQDTFLEAQQAFVRFQRTSERHLLASLRQTLLHNLATFGRRCRQPEQRQVVRDVSLDAAERLRGLLQIDASSPSSQAVRHEEAEALQQAIERLPEHYREVILLRHREQWSFE